MPLAAYKKIVDDYFANEGNKPFSVMECCDAMGIASDTLRAWEGGDEKAFAALAKRVKTKVAAGWEKGEVSPSLAMFLYKSYFGGEDGEGQVPLEIVLRVESNGA